MYDNSQKTEKAILVGVCRNLADRLSDTTSESMRELGCLAETAGADGLKIAETFPAGRGSPHGCGLRAVFCRDAASARPEACRDKSKAPRSGDVAGRSPGVQGAAATGRPLCAPGAIRDITQKTNRERKLR